jgi:hypothetical protein
MKINFHSYNQYSEPQSLSWVYDGQDVHLAFDSAISAVYSESLKMVFVENLSNGQIYLYSEDGKLVDKKEIPSVNGYRFVGINPNKKSASGIALLFHPEAPVKGNEWRDTEQYELLADERSILGRRLDIYR